MRTSTEQYLARSGGRGGATRRAIRLAVMVVIALAIPLGADGPVREALAAPCTTSVMTIVAHEDDDLLFVSPDLLHAIAGGQCARTVLVTAGDAGAGQGYWSSREAGSRAAYAEMAGVLDSWTQTDAGVPGHPMPLFTLAAAPNVSLVFMRLPDGNGGGNGFGATGHESLQKLWNGNITTMLAVDGSSSYTRTSLIDSLAGLMGSFQPAEVRTQDYVGSFGDGDHSDHHAVATFARAAHQQYATTHTFTGYVGYDTASRPINVSGVDLAGKQAAFLAYAPFDVAVCQSASGCAGTSYGDWLQRQYVAGSESGGGAAGESNIAGAATVTASSQNVATGQTAVKAVDGVVDGAPGDATKEWATVGGRVGSFLRLDWGSAVTLTRVVLHDRPNSRDRVTAGTLTFSDGTKVSVGALPNGGAPLTVNFVAELTTSLIFTVTGVSGSTRNVGLAEIEAWSPIVTGNRAPIADAGPARTVSGGSTVALDGTGSFDPDGDAITFAWSQTAGPGVTLSDPSAAMPTFTAPPAPATLAFQLVVDDGTLSSAPDTVTVTVSLGGVDVAGTAAGSASSQNVSTEQTADKAVDGVVDGWPGDYTKEWATVGGHAGSWLQLDWPSAVTLSLVVLHDRPNPDDQITSATLAFSDGTSLVVGALPNDGSPLSIPFPPKATTSLRLTATSVSGSTFNVGLSEIEAWEP